MDFQENVPLASDFESIADRLRRAIASCDLVELSEVVHVMRFGFRWDYQWVFRAAHDVSGISLAEWDELLMASDLQDSES